MGNIATCMPRPGVRCSSPAKWVVYFDGDEFNFSFMCLSHTINSMEYGIFGSVVSCVKPLERAEFKIPEPITCNRMCLLSEWDESKPRDCENCSGRTK